jgi:hypothetical protein
MSMRCLLCDCGAAPLERCEANVWAFTCPQCGSYRFDEAFARRVNRARIRREADTLAVVAAASEWIRHHYMTATLTLETLAWLRDRQVSRPGARTGG